MGFFPDWWVELEEEVFGEDNTPSEQVNEAIPNWLDIDQGSNSPTGQSNEELGEAVEVTVEELLEPPEIPEFNPGRRADLSGVEGLIEALKRMELFQPVPFNAANINVPLIAPSAQFRALESAISAPTSPFQQALRGASFSDDVTRFFNRDVAPGILQQFSGGPRGGGVFSGAARSALAGEFARLQEQERQRQFQRAFQAAPIASQILDVDRATRASQLANKIQVWGAQQGLRRDAVAQALQLAGLQLQGRLGFAQLEEQQRQFEANAEQAEAAAEAAQEGAIGGLIGTIGGGIIGGVATGGNPLGVAAGASIGGGIGSLFGGQPQYVVPTTVGAIQGVSNVAIANDQTFGETLGFGGSSVPVAQPQPQPIFFVPVSGNAFGSPATLSTGQPMIGATPVLGSANPFITQPQPVGIGIQPDVDPFSATVISAEPTIGFAR